MQVDRYDGQTIWKDGEPLYELGNFLGNGANSNVFEAEHLFTVRRQVFLCNIFTY